MYLQTVKMNFKLMCKDFVYKYCKAVFMPLEVFSYKILDIYSYDLTYFITSMQFTHLLII